MVDLDKLCWIRETLDNGDVSLTAVLIHRVNIRISKEELGLIEDTKNRLRIMTWRAFYGELFKPALELCEHAKYYARSDEAVKLCDALMGLIRDPVPKVGTQTA